MDSMESSELNAKTDTSIRLILSVSGGVEHEFVLPVVRGSLHLSIGVSIEPSARPKGAPSREMPSSAVSSSAASAPSASAVLTEIAESIERLKEFPVISESDKGYAMGISTAAQLVMMRARRAASVSVVPEYSHIPEQRVRPEGESNEHRRIG